MEKAVLEPKKGKATTGKVLKKKTVAPVTKKVAPKVNKAELDTKNIKDTIKQVVESEREIKYNYPPDIDNQLDRKTWRQKVRNKLRAYERQLSKLEDGKEKVALNKEYKAYRKEVLLVP